MADHDRVYKILVIDDERTLQAMLKSVLGAQGFDIVAAFSGEEGLALAQSVRPDFIVLDVIMPGIKGREVCRQLKADPLTKDIPVLFLTAKDSDDDVNAEMALGAVGHITKPINAMSLARKISSVLGV